VETVRVALLANKYRVQHETTTLTQKHKAELAELQRTIEDQIQSIADHDRRYQGLRKTLSQLTNTAKTNQRFVKGLQQDSEELQKSATSFQKECGKALTEKITELEDEKRTLQEEVETMTDKLAATQRKMRSTLDDLWIRFLVSESKRKDLAENLGKQEAALKEERKKRDELEKQFFSDVQSIPCQVVDSSVTLTKKIELLQATLDDATAHGSQNDQIKECLEALQPLRLTPVLKMQDIEKMNSTLNLVHERSVTVLYMLHVTILTYRTAWIRVSILFQRP
jgi:chromosome segregation ATPase